MLIMAKVALGLGTALAVSGAYVFHEGVISIDVEESNSAGTHLHFWVPATTVALGMRIVPRHHLEHAAAELRPYLPALREAAKELKRFPNARFVEVQDGTEHVFIGTTEGRIRIDAVSSSEQVHLRIPMETLQHVADRLEADGPTI
jgi:hypothetical protein